MYMKKENQTVLLVGVGILLLAALIILLAIFVPRARYKGEMKDRIDRILLPNPAYVTLSDPLFDTGDLLGRDGKEIVLEGEARAEVLTLLGEVQTAGLSYKGRESMATGAWDLRLLVRTAVGDTAQIWISESRLYYVENSVAYCFAVKDGAAHTALYTRMIAALEVEV